MPSTFARSAPSADRNKEPIRTELERVVPQRGLVLEIASGTGQHVVHFARAMPHLDWQPSDPDPDARASIAALAASERLPNIRPPVDLDARSPNWPIKSAHALLCINMIHIAPWKAAEGLFAGAEEVLGPEAPLLLYGPFRRGGHHTAPSNAAFDAQLRLRNPEWGVRDLEEVTQLAEANGIRLEDIVSMPANNFFVIYRRGGNRSREAQSSPTPTPPNVPI